jgi:hypothetical protein
MGRKIHKTGKKNAPENRNQGQTLLLRYMPQEKRETCQNACALVLLEVPKAPLPRTGNVEDRGKKHDNHCGLCLQRTT